MTPLRETPGRKKIDIVSCKHPVACHHDSVDTCQFPGIQSQTSSCKLRITYQPWLGESRPPMSGQVFGVSKHSAQHHFATARLVHTMLNGTGMHCMACTHPPADLKVLWLDNGGSHKHECLQAIIDGVVHAEQRCCHNNPKSTLTMCHTSES